MALLRFAGSAVALAIVLVMTLSPACIALSKSMIGGPYSMNLEKITMQIEKAYNNIPSLKEHARQDSLSRIQSRKAHIDDVKLSGSRRSMMKIHQPVANGGRRCSIQSKNVDVCNQADPAVNNYAGYAYFSDDISSEVDNKLFFWIFESRNNPEKDPIIIWLNGGPGCSSMIGLFTEMGPCTLKGSDGYDNEAETVPNKFSWNEFATVIFVDQPAGVGMSSSGISSPSTTVHAAYDFYLFLQSLLKEFPQFKGLPLHLAGESYGGHYVPAMAQVIVKLNKYSTERPHINLKSAMLGNPLTSITLQTPHFIEMASTGPYAFLDKQTADGYQKYSDYCTAILDSVCWGETRNTDTCTTIQMICWNLGISIALNNSINVYDIRESCTQNLNCSSDTAMKYLEKHINNDDFQKALGIEDPINFQACNMAVTSAFAISGDEVIDFSVDVAYLLNEGLPILVYAGDTDYICNWIGNYAWIKSLKWRTSPIENLPSLADIGPDSMFNGLSGKHYEATPLNFVTISNAGHMVPTNQPRAAFEMAKTWVLNNS